MMSNKLRSIQSTYTIKTATNVFINKIEILH